MERVVVTGIGAVASLGHNADELFANLVKGRSGVDKITQFDASGHGTQIAAEVKNLSFDALFDVKSLRRHDRYSLLAHVAAEEAVNQSGILSSAFVPERAGIFVSSGIGGIQTFEATAESFRERGSKGVSAFFISNLIANAAGGNLAIRYGFKGVNFAMVSACATGAHCIGEAFRAIRYGEQDIMLAGGSEAAVTPLTIAGFSNMKAMTRNNDSPQTASRPFDRDRDGFVMGEGSGVLVLESLSHARKRNAHILAELCGYGATCDAHHITAIAPGGEGIARASRLALDVAQVNADEVDYVNAHGTSTPLGDIYETEFLKSFFGAHAQKLWISSTKSMIGHLLGAAGGVESVVCVKSLLEDVVHPTINLDYPDEQCDLDYVPREARQKKLRFILKSSMGFGGHNAALLYRRFE